MRKSFFFCQRLSRFRWQHLPKWKLPLYGLMAVDVHDEQKKIHWVCG
jgi:hypothetical protein